MLPDTPMLLAFIGASLLLTLTPGPAVVYIIARAVAQGRTSGLASVLGVALGNLSNAIGAALGLAALFAVSAAAFTVVKWAQRACINVQVGVDFDGSDAQAQSLQQDPSRTGNDALSYTTNNTTSN